MIEIFKTNVNSKDNPIES